ncbi:MAG: GldG family protein [Thermofilum sp.]|nr:GldG family protein [Thermofilum sp.]
MRGAGLALTLALTAATLALLTAVYPVNADFSPDNLYWNGMSSLKDLGAVAASLAEACALDPSEHALLLVGPSKPFTEADARAVESFLARGGLVVVADDFGTANQLLEAIGAPVRLTGSLLADPLFNLGAPQLPLAFWGGRRLALNYATTVNASACGECGILAESSAFSYLNLNGRRDPGEPVGPFPVAVELRYGAGKLVVISDSSLFINSMLSREANRDFLQQLLASRKPVLVADRWEETPLTMAKELLRSAWRAASSPEVKYSLAALAFALSLEWGRRLARANKRF